MHQLALNTKYLANTQCYRNVECFIFQVESPNAGTHKVPAFLKAMAICRGALAVMLDSAERILDIRRQASATVNSQ